jgi:chemotaxis signal transduction protein
VKLDRRMPEEMSDEVRRLLDRRAERLRAPAPHASEETVLWAAEFPVGEESYAVPLEALRGAVPLKMVTAVPLSPPHVVGILRFQGQVITAMSLSSLLGGRGWREDPAVLLVVDAGLGGRLVALDCERIPKPVQLPFAAVEESLSRWQSAVVEVTLPGPRQVNLIDLRKLLDRRTGRSPEGAADGRSRALPGDGRSPEGRADDDEGRHD